MGLDSKELLQRLCSLADEGRVEDALEIFEDLKESYLQYPSADLVACFDFLGKLYFQKGNFERAAKTHIQGLTMARELKLSEEVLAQFYRRLGGIYDALGQDDKAVMYYEKAITFFEGLSPAHSIHIAYIHNNLGMLYKKSKRYELSQRHYQKAIRFLQEKHKEKDADLATIYYHLGRLFYDKEHYKEAAEMYERSLKIREEVLPKDHPEIAHVLGGLAVLFQELGEDEKADALYKKALSVSSLYLKDPINLRFYGNMAEHYADFLRKTAHQEEANQLEKQVKTNIEKEKGGDPKE